MLAVIELGSKQYIVEEGSIIDVEKIESDKTNIKIENILLVNDGKTTSVGQPTVKGASVTADILEQFKDEKETVFKFKRKTGYKKTQGHRQNLTRLQIKGISLKAAAEKSSAAKDDASANDEKPKKETKAKTTAKKETEKETAKES